MPNWTDEAGNSLFMKLECKRCLNVFDINDCGEVMPHECIGGAYTSESKNGEYHVPVKFTLTPRSANG